MRNATTTTIKAANLTPGLAISDSVERGSACDFEVESVAYMLPSPRYPHGAIRVHARCNTATRLGYDKGALAIFEYGASTKVVTAAVAL